MAFYRMQTDLSICSCTYWASPGEWLCIDLGIVLTSKCATHCAIVGVGGLKIDDLLQNFDLSFNWID